MMRKPNKNYHAVSAEIAALIKAMTPELKRLSFLSHELAKLGDANPEIRCVDALVNKGRIMDSVAAMCAPRVGLLGDIADALSEIEETETETRATH
jgi:hypothetical protein